MEIKIRFKNGDRVFDTDCGEFGTILQYTSESTVVIEYDHDCGCDTNVCDVPVCDLELA